MDRRKFLRRSTSLVAGSFFGLSAFSKAFALGNHDSNPFQAPCVSLIIDDIGFSPCLARKFLNLKIPLTFSVLPGLKWSRDLAVEIHERGHEVMLHQPMEPYGPKIDPGPGALYLGFSSDKIADIIEENLDSVPYAAGVNNHMGSKYTECRDDVYEVLKVINGDGLFFIDSLTSCRSTAYVAARRLRMSSAFRNRFLDNVPRASAIHSQICRLIKCAFKYGHAIGIAHPYPETIEAMTRFSGEFEKAGVSLVSISHILSLQRPAYGQVSRYIGK